MARRGPGRPPGGKYTKAGSTVISVRVEEDLALAVEETARNAGAANVREWLRALLRQNVDGTNFGTARRGSGVLIEHGEGWKAGWAAANRQFRKALAEVIAADMPEPT